MALNPNSNPEEHEEDWEVLSIPHDSSDEDEGEDDEVAEEEEDAEEVEEEVNASRDEDTNEDDQENGDSLTDGSGATASTPSSLVLDASDITASTLPSIGLDSSDVSLVNESSTDYESAVQETGTDEEERAVLIEDNVSEEEAKAAEESPANHEDTPQETEEEAPALVTEEIALEEAAKEDSKPSPTAPNEQDAHDPAVHAERSGSETELLRENPAPKDTASPVKSCDDDDDAPGVHILVNMGFERDQAREAFALARGDVEAAANHLLSPSATAADKDTAAPVKSCEDDHDDEDPLGVQILVNMGFAKDQAMEALALCQGDIEVAIHNLLSASTDPTNISKEHISKDGSDDDERTPFLKPGDTTPADRSAESNTSSNSSVDSFLGSSLKFIGDTARRIDDQHNIRRRTRNTIRDIDTQTRNGIETVRTESQRGLRQAGTSARWASESVAREATAVGRKAKTLNEQHVATIT